MQLAEYLGISQDLVSDWIKEGLPGQGGGGRAGSVYSMPAVFRWVVKRELARAGATSERDKARILAARAQREEEETARLAGTLVNKRAYDAARFADGRQLREALTLQYPRCVHLVVGLPPDEAEAKLRADFEKLLDDFAAVLDPPAPLGG